MTAAVAAAAQLEGKRLSGVRLLFIANVDWFLLSHRGHLVRRAVQEGAEVEVWCGDTGRMADIEALGASVRALPLRRGGLHLHEEVRLLCVLTARVGRHRPDVVQNVSVKPVLYGTLAARLWRTPTIVNSVSGFGYALEGGDRPAWLRHLVLAGYRLILRSSRVMTVFQNGEAAEQFVGRGIVKAERTSLVRGSGVDLEVFSALPEPPGPPVVLFPSRMLWDKGLREFVQAARLVRAERRDVRFVLVGAPDPENRASASERDLQDIVAEGCCEWWGHRSDMAEVLGQCHVVVLPSYHEGLPKVLVEAAAVGRVVVTSDIPGCRAALTHPSAGRLVPVRDAAAIAAAVIGWLDDPAERRRAARAAVEGAAAFATPVIQEQFLELWGARR